MKDGGADYSPAAHVNTFWVKGGSTTECSPLDFLSRDLCHSEKGGA